MTDIPTEPRVFRPTNGRPRAFRFIGTETRTTVVEIETWESICTTCGRAFQIEVSAARSTRDSNFQLVNCPEHRNCTPGHGGGRPAGQNSGQNSDKSPQNESRS